MGARVARERQYRSEVHSMSEQEPAGEASTVPGIMNRSSPYSVQVTVERLRAAILNHGLTIFAQVDHSDEARRVGLTMQEAHLLIFGSPRAGTPLMVASPLLALELPLKALIWQDSVGQVWVTNTSAEYLAQRFAIPAELVKNIAGVDRLIAGALQS